MPCNPRFAPQLFKESLNIPVIQHGEENSDRIKFSLDVPLSGSFIVENVHGNQVILANPIAEKADAHVLAYKLTDKKPCTFQYLAIRTADCLPVAFYFQNSEVFIGGIAHAGWRGLTSHILTNIIEKLTQEAMKYDVEPTEFLSQLNAFIAPGIFGVSYECGNDVKQALCKHKEFLSQNETFQKYDALFDLLSDVSQDQILKTEITLFEKSLNRTFSPHSIFPDLQLIAVLECLTEGLQEKNITLQRTNTFGHEKLPSFREKSLTGRTRHTGFWTHLVLP